MSGLEIPLLLGIAGGAVGAVGSLQEGAANSAAALADADAAEANAITADQDRVQALRTAKIAKEDKARENRRTLASMRAAFGASGGDLMGSPIEVLEDTAAELSLDELRLEDEGRARNREGGLAIMNYKREAGMSRARAKNARTAGMFNAFSALTSGIRGGLSRTS